MVFLLAFSSYGSIFSHEFIAYDDIRIIVANTARYDGMNIENLKAIFFTDFPREEPLLIRDISYLINAEIFGPTSPGGFLFGNVILHILCSLAVYQVGLLLFPSQPITAAISALFFTVHPLHSESIAWISARKETLFTFFSLMAFITYVKYTLKNKSFFLLISIFFFILALFSKAAAISFFPIIFFYRITVARPCRVTIKEVLYFFFIVILTLSFVTWYTQILTDFGVLNQEKQRDYLNWFLVTLQTLTFYIHKLLIPTGLSAVYTFPSPYTVYTFPVFLLFSILLWACITAYFVLNKSPQKQLHLFLLLWFIAALLPYLDLAQVGIYVADRYAYLSSVPFILATSTILRSFYVKISKNNFICATIFTILFVGLISCAIFQTRKNAAVWQNSTTLWMNVKKKTPDNLASYSALMGEYLKKYQHSTAESKQEQLKKAKMIGKEAMELFTYDGGKYEKALYLITSQLGQIAWFEKNYPKVDYYFNLTWKLNPKFLLGRYIYAQALAGQERFAESLQQIDIIKRFGNKYGDRQYLLASKKLKQSIEKKVDDEN